MIRRLKNKIYFFIAGYFGFFAAIRLKKWKPQIAVLTGSNGKTTLLHLIESQLRSKAKYSHKANSSFGIPFDILGLERESFKAGEWLYLFLAAPFSLLKKIPQEKLYIVEADCDRPGEGKFLSELLKPSAVIWVSLGRTHTMNFDSAVLRRDFKSVEESIAYEFGWFLEFAKDLAVINGDAGLMQKQAARSKAKIITVSEKQLASYKIMETSTEFIVAGTAYYFNCLMPKETFYSIAAVNEFLKFLGFKFFPSYQNFALPPGRSSILNGIKNIKIIDSSYNSNFQSCAAVVESFKLYPAKVKWAVLGDFLEQGKEEAEEHEKLAGLIKWARFDKVILMGPRVVKYTYPKLEGLNDIEKFETPKEALDFLQTNLQGDEAVLFKGARFMEGIIEHLLLHKSDVSKLCRREQVWEDRRKEWGL